MRFILVFTLLIFPKLLFAAEFFMETNNSEPIVEETFVVDVYVNSLEAANLVAGTVVFDESLLSLERITFGNSIVNFWIERPSERQPAEVSFAGLVAGGFSSTEALVLTMHLRAKTVGQATLNLTETKVLAHDGLGTELKVLNQPLVLNLKTGIPGEAVAITDTEAPESFKPELVRRDDWFDGQAVLVFDTVDKGTGIEAYYVKEFAFSFMRPFKSWQLVSSPYVLNDQTERSIILIKAVDRAGNSEVVAVLPAKPRSVVMITSFGLLGLLLLFYWRRKRKHAKPV